jgi:acetyl esterase
MDQVPRADDVEPDLREYLDSPLSTFPDFGTSSADEVRAHFAEMRTAAQVPEVAEVQDTSFEGPDGSVAVRIYRSSAGSSVPAIVWFHGGGWVLGDLETAELPARELCVQTGFTVLSVEYRLAPETPFPGAFEDCVAALTWARSSADELRIDRDRIIVGGDSAGANLAAAVAVADSRTHGSLLGQLLIYPVVQPKARVGGYGIVGDGFGLSEAAMDWFWDHYVPEESEREDWRVNLANADPTGTADAFVLTCGYDPLAAEGIGFVARLEGAGVDVVAEHLPGGIHGVFAMNVASGERARSSASAWVRTRIENSRLEDG